MLQNMLRLNKLVMSIIITCDQKINILQSVINVLFCSVIIRRALYFLDGKVQLQLYTCVRRIHIIMVELNGGRYHLHANNLRQFNVRAEEVECKSVSCDMCSNVDDMLYVNSCNVIYENDVDFGELVLIDPNDCET